MSFAGLQKKFCLYLSIFVNSFDCFREYSETSLIVSLMLYELVITSFNELAVLVKIVLPDTTDF